MPCSSLSNDSVPSALLHTDVLSDYAYCDQALSLPIGAVQCAHSATYVSALKFALKGKSPVSAQDSKKFGPAGLLRKERGVKPQNTDAFWPASKNTDRPDIPHSLFNHAATVRRVFKLIFDGAGLTAVATLRRSSTE